VSSHSGPETPIPFTAELQRKALHLLTLIIPLSLIILGPKIILYILVPLATVSIIADVARVRVAWFNHFISRVFGFMMRENELPALGTPIVYNGASWVLLGSVLTIACFSPIIAATSLSIFLLGDAAAALVGRRWGKIKWGTSSKSIEGSLAFFLSTAPVAFFMPDLVWWIGLIGAAAGALAEALPGPFNDNLRVPLLAGLALQGLTTLFVG
jgi:dolichol kinase